MRTIVCAIAVAAACVSGRRRQAADPPPTLASQTGCGTAAAAPVAGHEGAHDRAREHRLRPDHRLAAGAEHERARRRVRAATDYHGIQFPSLPNYIALTSGQVPPAIAGDGVKGVDCLPSPTCQSTDPSIFTQIDAAAAARRPAPRPPGAPTPRACRRTAGSRTPGSTRRGTIRPSTTRTTPPRAPVRRAVRNAGRRGARIRSGRGDAAELRAFIPNLCNDGHDSCGGVPRVAEEDATSAAWMPQILASPDYQSGHLLVVITADTSHRRRTATCSRRCS